MSCFLVFLHQTCLVPVPLLQKLQTFKLSPPKEATLHYSIKNVVFPCSLPLFQKLQAFKLSPPKEEAALHYSIKNVVFHKGQTSPHFLLVDNFTSHLSFNYSTKLLHISFFQSHKILIILWLVYYSKRENIHTWFHNKQKIWVQANTRQYSTIWSQYDFIHQHIALYQIRNRNKNSYLFHALLFLVVVNLFIMNIPRTKQKLMYRVEWGHYPFLSFVARFSSIIFHITPKTSEKDPLQSYWNREASVNGQDGLEKLLYHHIAMCPTIEKLIKYYLLFLK